MADPNPNLSPNITHQPSLLGGAENMKLLFDNIMALTLANQRGYDAIAVRRAENAATVDHMVNVGAVLSGQIGVTEGQQTVSPAATSAGEAIKGAVGVAGAGQAVNAEDVTTVATKLAEALVAAIVTAAGGASTPSQTQAKPTS